MVGSRTSGGETDYLSLIRKAVEYQNKNQISVQGFRKGKAPQAIIEKLYGASIFYEDAANELQQP